MLWVFTGGFKSKQGVGKRGTGFMIAYLCHIALLVLSIYSGLKIANLVTFTF